jgi:hypothetical protein
MTETTVATAPQGWRQVLRPQSTPTADGLFYTTAFIPDDGKPVEWPFTDEKLDEDLLAAGKVQRFNWVRRRWQDAGMTDADMAMATQAKTIADQQAKINELLSDNAKQAVTIATLQKAADAVPAIQTQVLNLVMAGMAADTAKTDDTKADTTEPQEA